MRSQIGKEANLTSTRDLAASIVNKLELEQVPYAAIVDALMLAGVNVSLKIYGPERTLEILRNASEAVVTLHRPAGGHH